ncbi:MAG: hypothetical protein WAN03_10260 [Candidatus Sulfotelmatobacter sp.]
MRTIRMAMIAASLVAGSMLAAAAWAQTSNAAPNQTQPSPAQSAAATRVAPGTVIPVQLTKSVDAKKAKTGEEVKAKVTEDMKTQSGQVLIPKDTEILGHVTSAQARSKQEKESDLGIIFDRAVLKDGNDMTMPASIQAVIAPPSNTPNNGEGGGGAVPSASASGYPAGGGGGRSGSMGGGMQSPTNPAPIAGEVGSEQAGNASSPRPPITSSTQGVIGISDYRLSAAADAKQGSVVSSEKSNVKLESGTLMLLRVNQ